MQRGNVRALEEFPDGNLLAPEQRFLHRRRPVRRVVSGVVLELFHTRTEPLVSVVMVIGDARAEDVQEREARMLDALLDQLGEMLLLGAVAAANAREIGLTGASMLPKGMLFVFMPMRLVGEVWPVVRP